MLVPHEMQEKQLKKISIDDLRRHDGREGRPAWVGWDGKVYDVTGSRLWKEGVHVRKHNAGQDLTSDMDLAPHDDSVFEGWELVGELAAQQVAEAAYPEPAQWEQAILDQHPHPISVHFPIALSLSAALFTALSLLLEFMNISFYQYFEWAALFNVLLGAIGTPVSIATGYMSWWYNYGRTATPIFRTKILLSWVLVGLFVTAFVLRFISIGLGDAGGGIIAFRIYEVLVLAGAPVVVALGFYGGKITFPS